MSQDDCTCAAGGPDRGCPRGHGMTPDERLEKHHRANNHAVAGLLEVLKDFDLILETGPAGSTSIRITGLALAPKTRSGS